MKVTLLGAKDFDSLEYHIDDSLKHLAHEVTHIDIRDVSPFQYKYDYWLMKLSNKYYRSLFNKITKKVLDSEPELIICTYRFIHPDCIRIIKKALKNVPIVHINPDALTTFEAQQIFVSPYDAYFTKDPYIVRFMKDKMNLNTFYLPEAFNPRIHKPPLIDDRIRLETEACCDIVAFGTMYPYRSNVLALLAKAGFKLNLYGSQDRRFPNEIIKPFFSGEYITGARKSQVLFGAKVVLNNFHYAEVEGVNVKFFEIWGSGGFQICDYKPVIDSLTKTDASRFTFKNTSEAIELIKHYLDKPKERYSIVAEQLEHFREHHTYEQRLQTVFDKVFA